MAKVVYNACFGGFGLSSVAVVALRDLGHPPLQDEEKFAIAMEYGRVDIARHDPLLIQVVETLGKAAADDYADLHIHEIRGTRYRIDEYDGAENVQEPDDIEWTNID